jgi:peptide/nickel transport system substrate-binding protein
MKETNPEIGQVPVLQAAEGMMMDNAVAPFNSLQVREAMQLAINLPLITQTYYNGSVSPIPQTLTLSTMGGGWGDPYPDWPASLQAQYAYNPTLAEQLLTQGGYPNGFTTTCVVNNSSDLELLQIVVSELASININVNLTLMDNASWGAYVISNKKATALTYSDGRPLGNAYSPIRQLELFMNGYGADYGFVNDPTFNAFYPAAMAATDVTQIQQIVANANLEVAQQHFALSIVSPNLYAFVQPWLKGYNGQNASSSGGAGYTGFYMARYWVDQSAK